MQRKVGTLSFVVLALVLTFSGTEATFYKDYVSINSRVPGDQLLWKSTSLKQNLNFFANVNIVLRYPQDLSHSSYILTHFLVTGQDDTGYVGFTLDSGGPGSDNMSCKIVLNSIQNGNFQATLYGKKK